MKTFTPTVTFTKKRGGYVTAQLSREFNGGGKIGVFYNEQKAVEFAKRIFGSARLMIQPELKLGL